MNVNGITAADEGSQSGPDPPPSSYQHHQSIMEYDYLWIPNHYNSDLDSGCGTGHGTAQKQQQSSHAFQGHYPINRTIGNSQQAPVTRDQHWGKGCPGQEQGESSVTVPYSHGMYGVYPNQVLNQQQQHFGMVPNGAPCYQSQHTLLSSEQSEPLTPLMPTAQMFTTLRGSLQHHHMGHGSTDSSMPVQALMRSPNAKHDNCSPQRKQSPGRGTVDHSAGIQVCRNDSKQEVDQDYSDSKKISATQQLFPIDSLSVKASGTSLLPTNEHNLQAQQLVDIETTFKELSQNPVCATSVSAATTFHQTISEPTLVALRPLSVQPSVSAKPGISTPSALSTTPQLLSTPSLKVQPLSSPMSPSIVTLPATISTLISDSSQMSQGIKASPSQSLASHFKTSAVQHIALSPVVDSPDSKGLQVTQSPLSQSTYLPVLPRPSYSLAPMQRALITPPNFPSPQTNLLTDTAIDNSIPHTFPTSVAVASSFPFSASVSSQKLLSAQTLSESPLIANTNAVLSTCQETDHAAFHDSEQQNSDMTCCPLKTKNISELSWTYHKVNVTGSVCKSEGHSSKVPDKIPESSLSIPYTEEPDKNILPVVKKDVCTSKDQSTSGKNALNDIRETETNNCISLAGIVYFNRSEAVDCCVHNQDESSLMLEDRSIINKLGDMLPENDQTDGTACKTDAVDLTTKNSNDMTSLKDNSQIHNSLDDSPQADISQHSSLNDFSGKCNKGLLKDIKKKRIKSSSKAPKDEKVKGKKKKEEQLLTSKKSKSEVPASASCLHDGASSLLLKGGFITDLQLTHNVTYPVLKSENIRKSKTKETAGKCSKPSKIKVVLAEKAKEGNDDSNLITEDTPRRRIATEEQVIFPLFHGWRREIRVRKLDNRLKGETWYYTPCGKRIKQFPEVIKYLKRHEENLKGVTREHFSFSPRMPVGDFYEERDTPEGKKWFLLANEEVPSMIMAITGRRGRPPNPDKESKPQCRSIQPKGGPRRRPGRPPKLKVFDLLSKIDARLLKRLEAKELLTEEDKVKLSKIKKKMKKKARMKRMEDANNRKIRQEKLKAKNAREPMQEGQAPSLDTDINQSVSDQLKKPGCRRKVSVERNLEKVCPLKRIAGARSKAKALAKAQAEAEAQAQASLAAKRQAERRAQAKRRLEERKRQQKILEELKKPTEDMCLTDHMPLPELSRIPGLVLSGFTFSCCITVVEFLHSYGKVLGLQVPKDIPSLATLQEGLLGLGKSQSKLLDLLINLVNAVLHDPGLPSYYQSVKILGEKLVDLELSHNTVSEVLRVFLESHGFERNICNSLRTKSFPTLSPEVKASILAFLVEELNASNTVINEIDNTLENMITYKKNKWITEGKVRKMKAALARKTGRSEDELCLEERRRSTRVCVAEDETLPNSSFLENGSSRQRKDELKIYEAESLNNASVPELERQIDKLTKRQDFFRKKLLISSHCMRAMLLGQDRYQRRYWLLPNIGGVLVEGPEEILASGDTLMKDEPKPSVEKEFKFPVKVDDIVDPQLSPMHSATNTNQPFCPHPSNISSISSAAVVEPLPGEASLMCTPRGWGRPRKIRPEVELHLRTVKNRRHRYNKSGAENSKGASQPEDFMKEPEDKRQMLPKESCKEESLYSCASMFMPSFKETLLPHGTSPHFKPVTLPKTPRPGRRCRKGSGTGYRNIEAVAVKRRGRPPSSHFQEMEQNYFKQLVVRPIPQEMVKGWWWIRKPEELTAILTALHPRGIRERVLLKNLTKHMEFLTECCTQPIADPVFHLKVEDDRHFLEAVKHPWVEQNHAMQTDLSILQMVEDLEHRVLGADLQLKDFTAPEPDSTREDLQYYEHEVDPREDWMLRSKKEWWDLLRVLTNPLDLAVMRLTNLERHIERRYLKGPLWNLAEVMRLAPLTSPPGGEEITMDTFSLENEITPRLRIWRQALGRCRSASQLSLCLLQLERAISWEKSIIKVTCQVCHKGDNDAFLLLCDGCDHGWHMFCLRPKVTQVPEGDWFCPTCHSLESGTDSQTNRSARQRAKAQKRRPAHGVENSNEEQRHRKSMTTLQKYVSTPSSGSSYPLPKRKRMATRNQPDLTYCEIILMEMEAHADAWPFLEPVNPRLVPGYRRIIKNPMDFLTMRERLLKGGYSTCEEFAADAQLVFNNCELFNEDTSEVGMAGHSMRHFFESRWAEFYSKCENRGLANRLLLGK